MADKLEYAEFATEQVDVRGELAFEQGVTQLGSYTLTGSASELAVPQKFMDTIKALGDTSPTFATYAVPMGFSHYLSYDESASIPNRFWPESFLDSLINKVNEQGLPGYRGHASEWEMSSLPNPAVMWVAAAKAVHEQTGNQAALVRGYVYPIDGNIPYVKTGAFDNVSPSALVKARPEVIEGQECMFVEQSNVLSLDFVRKGMQGFKGAKQIASEGATMKRKPEEITLISELAVQELKEFNPALYQQIASEASAIKQSDTTAELTTQIGTLVKEKIGLMVNASVAEEMATVLGCEVAKLPELAKELASLKIEQVKTTLAAELAKIESTDMRKAVEAEVSKRTYNNPAEAVLAVESAVSLTKSIIAAMGGQLGGQNSEQKNEKGNSVASPAMQKMMEGK